MKTKYQMRQFSRKMTALINKVKVMKLYNLLIKFLRYGLNNIFKVKVTNQRPKVN